MATLDHANPGTLTRRTFLGAGVAGGATLLTGGIGSLFHVSTAAAADAPWIEASIPQLRA